VGALAVGQVTKAERLAAVVALSRAGIAHGGQLRVLDG
jgi:hypothetical protein